jgi:hypothetical protein
VTVGIIQYWTDKEPPNGTVVKTNFAEGFPCPVSGVECGSASILLRQGPVDLPDIVYQGEPCTRPLYIDFQLFPEREAVHVLLHTDVGNQPHPNKGSPGQGSGRLPLCQKQPTKNGSNHTMSGAFFISTHLLVGSHTAVNWWAHFASGFGFELDGENPLMPWKS